MGGDTRAVCAQNELRGYALAAAHLIMDSYWKSS